MQSATVVEGETVDPETGEIGTAMVSVLESSPLKQRSLVELAMCCARIEQVLSEEPVVLDKLPGDLHQLAGFAKAIYRWHKQAEAVTVALMVARQSKKIGDPKMGPAMSLKTETDWTFDEAQLKKLLDLIGQPDGITEEEYEKAMRYKFDPSKSVLNELAKRGGAVAGTINLGVRGTPKNKLVLEGGRT